MSNSLDPDQARRIVGPDLGPNCLPWLSADDTGRQRVKPKKIICICMQIIAPCENFNFMFDKQNLIGFTAYSEFESI